MATIGVVASARAADFTPAEVLIVDEQNGWPVPLVELKTTHSLRFVADNAGVIALDAPELLDREIWLAVEGHGYGVRADGFGNQGVRVTPRAGEQLIVKVQRRLPAKRLGRLTGAGLFGESQQLGRRRDWKESGVFGCDSVQSARYRGRMFWLWGDTTMPGYPLGIFNASGATTPIVQEMDWRPPLTFPARYDYFRNERGAPRGVADVPGPGPTWLSGLIVLPDDEGTQRLVACYEKIKPPMSAYEKGLCMWDQRREAFLPVAKIWSADEGPDEPPPGPTGHPVIWQDDSGETWALFGDPFPHLRCRATLADWRRGESWEKLQPQGEVPAAGDEKKMVKPHRGAIAYNEFRQRWVAVFTQSLGAPSAFGELWYAEADQPTGPWGPAVKIVTHGNYTFYNPALHPEMTPAESPVLLFEATYTSAFADHAAPTPRHDYNQVMYRLDLDDPSLAPAHR